MNKRIIKQPIYHPHSIHPMAKNPKTKEMLKSMFCLLKEKVKDPLLAWDHLVEFLAANNSARLLTKLNHNFEWLTSNSILFSDLINIYDSDLLKSDHHDYLGELYIEIIAQYKNQKTKDDIAESEAARIANEQITSKSNICTILDPSAGTGRLLMAAHKIAPNVKFFGVEKDLRKFRIAYTNLAINNIPGYLLNADPSRHEINISTEYGKHNWQYANNWNDIQNKLLPLYDTLFHQPFHSHINNIRGIAR